MELKAAHRTGTQLEQRWVWGEAPAPSHPEPGLALGLCQDLRGCPSLTPDCSRVQDAFPAPNPQHCGPADGIFIDRHWDWWALGLVGISLLGRRHARSSLWAYLLGCRVLSPAELSWFGFTVISCPKCCTASPGQIPSALATLPMGKCLFLLLLRATTAWIQHSPSQYNLELPFLFCKDMNQPFNVTPLPLLAKALKPKWFQFFF